MCIYHFMSIWNNCKSYHPLLYKNIIHFVHLISYMVRKCQVSYSLFWVVMKLYIHGYAINPTIFLHSDILIAVPGSYLVHLSPIYNVYRSCMIIYECEIFVLFFMIFYHYQYLFTIDGIKLKFIVSIIYWLAVW